MEMVCAFSGHRPEKLPWGDREDDPRCRALKRKMERTLRDLLERDCRTFLCGMARGADFYYAEALSALKREYPLELEAVIPCPSQMDLWSRTEQQRYLRLLDCCDRITVLEQTYTKGCMLRRNRSMVERANVLLTVFDGSPGGTAATIRYAKSRGIPVVALWR